MLALAIGAVGAAGADPSPPPRTGIDTCGQRFPADGPAGVDLQLGCLVSEIVAHYTGTAGPIEPAPLSSYVPQMALIAALAAAILLGLFGARRILGRRLAPVLPDEWWSCTACHSVNAVTSERCYRCGAPRSADADTLRTVDHPVTPQAFGHDWRDD